MKRPGLLLSAVLLGAGALPRPTPVGPPIAFPRDHGAHPEAALEWWYWTGHLSGDGDRPYGFQLTFFRLRDVHLAHFAWSDIASRAFRYEEKLHLSLPGIAGAAEGRLDVFNEDWSARAEGIAHRLRARTEVGELELALTPVKAPVLNGEGGLSRKGPGPNDYSRYVSITRLAVSGSLSRAGRRESLSGTAWFDHEWGPGAMPEEAVGWDWFALQLDDGSELMLYRMRLKNGEPSPFSAGTYVPPSGPPRPIAWSEVRLSVRSTWTSPHSKATYPADWSLSVASLGLEVAITPRLADQELSTRQTGVTYWEGACRVEGTRNSRPATGRAYVEMTGYAGRDVPGSSPP